MALGLQDLVTKHGLDKVLKKSKPTQDWTEFCMDIPGKLDQSKDNVLRQLLYQPPAPKTLESFDVSKFIAQPGDVIGIDLDQFGFDESRKTKIILKFDLKQAKRKRDEDGESGRKRGKSD